jgi:enoyl-CoA hydratase
MRLSHLPGNVLEQCHDPGVRKLIDIENQGGVAIVTLAHGKANAMDLELCTVLAEVFTRLAEDEAAAVIVTGRGPIFSAGVDLLRMLSSGPDYVRQFVPALCTMCDVLLRFPKPLVAAINGHAIAGGCILACAADRRLMALGDGRIGLPELRVGVPFPDVALEIMRNVLAPSVLEELVLTAVTLDAPAAAMRGLVHEIVEPAALGARALSVANELAALRPEAFRETKRQLRAPALERLDRLDPSVPEATAEVWSSPATIEAIRAYVDRTLRRPAS